MATRRQSFAQVHERRMQIARETLASPPGNEATRARSRSPRHGSASSRERFAEQLAKLDGLKSPQLKSQDLAVCVIEVNE